MKRTAEVLGLSHMLNSSSNPTWPHTWLSKLRLQHATRLITKQDRKVRLEISQKAATKQLRVLATKHIYSKASRMTCGTQGSPFPRQQERLSELLHTMSEQKMVLSASQRKQAFRSRYQQTNKYSHDKCSLWARCGCDYLHYKQQEGTEEIW